MRRIAEIELSILRYFSAGFRACSDLEVNLNLFWIIKFRDFSILFQKVTNFHSCRVESWKNFRKKMAMVSVTRDNVFKALLAQISSKNRSYWVSNDHFKLVRSKIFEIFGWPWKSAVGDSGQNVKLLLHGPLHPDTNPKRCANSFTDTRRYVR